MCIYGYCNRLFHVKKELRWNIWTSEEKEEKQKRKASYVNSHAVDLKQRFKQLKEIIFALLYFIIWLILFDLFDFSFF